MIYLLRRHSQHPCLPPRSAARSTPTPSLTSQGWRGKGHSLHPTNDATGLKHHILIKRDGNDGAGLGLKKDHKVEAWWMNAFDQALKGIDTTSGTMKRTAGGGNLDLDKIVSKGVYKYSGGNGLYSSFVKGGLLAGTVDKNLVSTTGLLTPPDSGVSTPAATTEEESGSGKKESKEERRARREAKKLQKAEKVARLEKEAKAAAKATKKATKKAEKKAKETFKAGETKEERKARRNARRARKEEKRRLRASAG
ncbi:hypothetical protein PG994_007908 [Apiospora phragmitis]|uniref:Uncharacterized protein n=1 Tax=Apiospora phragmitis TaxID=2905665 RepID=A0ABR1URL6_9PEZI